MVPLANALSVSVAKLVAGKDDDDRKGYKAAQRDTQGCLKTMDH